MGHRRDAADGAGYDSPRDLKPSIDAPLNSQHTRVYVGRVPSSLCLHEPGIRQLFELFGAIHSITIHHDALSIGADGFLFLEFADASAARAAVDAVTKADETNDPTFEGMSARLAVARGASSFQPDASVVDLLLGRRHTNTANHSFSQHSTFLSQHDGVDEDELMLQSLSQRATRRSSHGVGKKKRKKRHNDDDN